MDDICNDISINLHVDPRKETLIVEIKSSEIESLSVHVHFTKCRIQFQQGPNNVVRNTLHNKSSNWIALVQDALMFEWASKVHDVVKNNATLVDLMWRVPCVNFDTKQQESTKQELAAMIEKAMNIPDILNHTRRCKKTIDLETDAKKNGIHNTMKHYDRLFELALQTSLYGDGDFRRMLKDFSVAQKSDTKGSPDYIYLSAIKRPDSTDAAAWDKMFEILLLWCKYDNAFSMQFKAELTSMSTDWPNRCSKEEAMRHLGMCIQKRAVEECHWGTARVSRNQIKNIHMEREPYSVVVDCIEKFAPLIVSKGASDTIKLRTGKRKRVSETGGNNATPRRALEDSYTIVGVKNVCILTDFEKQRDNFKRKSLKTDKSVDLAENEVMSTSQTQQVQALNTHQGGEQPSQLSVFPLRQFLAHATVSTTAHGGDIPDLLQVDSLLSGVVSQLEQGASSLIVI